MVHILFTLSMPNNNSWNGKWSGEGSFYGIIRASDEDKAKTILDNGSYYYNFGDGWCASVSVEEISKKDVKGTQKKLKGFCGYDWMVSSIIKHGKIQAD